jgi:hypothetical protein
MSSWVRFSMPTLAAFPRAASNLTCKSRFTVLVPLFCIAAQRGEGRPTIPVPSGAAADSVEDRRSTLGGRDLLTGA